MKKITAIALILALLLVMLPACGNGSGSGSDNLASETPAASSAEEPPEESETSAPEEASAEAPVSAEELEPESEPESEPETAGDPVPNFVELPISQEPLNMTLWTTVNPMLADTINSLDQCALWDELEARTNIHMDGKLISAMAGQEQFQLMMASGDYTDLLDSPGSNYSTGLQGAMDDDVLLDLTDLVAEVMPNYSAIVATNDEYIQGTKVDDGRIGMIYNLKPETYMPTEGPVIRQD